MAELKQKDILKPKIELHSISEYIDKYAPGVTPQAISYAMAKDKVDFCWIGTDRYVVMTDKTRSYVPNNSSARDAKPAKTHKAIMRL